MNPRSRAARSTRNTRLSYVLSIKSAQRESNPHFRHGKATGCRYIMGAFRCAELSNNKSTGRDSNPRRRTTNAARGARCGILASWTTSAFVSVGPEGLEPSPGGLRVRCAAASTLIPFSASFAQQSARRESNPQSDPYKRPALTVELRAVSGAERDSNPRLPD